MVFFRLLLQHSFIGVICWSCFTGCIRDDTNRVMLSKHTDWTEESPCSSQPHSHWLYHIIPKHRSQLRWYAIGHQATWALFGNDDDGIFGEDQSPMYRPNQQNGLAKAVAWWCRNPLHNFCFYVIGSAHRCNSEIDILQIVDNKISGLHYRSCGHKLFAGKGSSLYIALHGGKPFISLRICYPRVRYSLDFYIGWRERGNFGIKFLPFCKNRESSFKNDFINGDD